MLNVYNPAGKQDFLKKWANEITKLRAQIADIMADQRKGFKNKSPQKNYQGTSFFYKTDKRIYEVLRRKKS